MPIGSSIALNSNRPDVRQQYNWELPDVTLVARSEHLLLRNRISLTNCREVVLINSTNNPEGQSRAGEGMPPDDLVRQSKFGTNRANFVLE
jgi:hypothetical protein